MASGILLSLKENVTVMKIWKTFGGACSGTLRYRFFFNDDLTVITMSLQN